MSLKRYLMMGAVLWAGCARQSFNSTPALSIIAPRPEAPPVRQPEFSLVSTHAVDTVRVADSIRAVGDSRKDPDSS